MIRRVGIGYKNKVGWSMLVLSVIAALVLLSCEENATEEEKDSSLCLPSNIGDPHPTLSSYTLVKHDEFNASALDTAVWQYDTGGNDAGWGNGELQHYTSKTSPNAYIEDCSLVIEAKKESRGGKNYTSARLHTHGTLSVHYGVIEARIKLPVADNGATDNGTWPAFWMLGDNFGGWGHNVDFSGDTDWPSSGEIDIMESNSKEFGYSRTLGTVHFNEKAESTSFADASHSYKGGNTVVSHLNSQYHIFGIEWTSTFIKFYVDRVLFHTHTIDPATETEFQKPFFLLLNVAVGGHFVNAPNSDNYPQKMFVDWVRIYQ